MKIHHCGHGVFRQMVESVSHNNRGVAEGGKVIVWTLVIGNSPQLKGEHIRTFCDGLNILITPSLVAYLQTL